MIDIQKMLVDRLDIFLEEIGYLGLRQPKTLVFKAALDMGFAILCLIKNQIRGWRWFRGFAHADSPRSSSGSHAQP